MFKSGILIALFFAFSANAMDVVFLTQPMPQVLKTWSTDQLNKFPRRGSKGRAGEVSAQSFIFDDSSHSLSIDQRADIDLITLRGDNGIARVPRFMVWRGFLKFSWDPNTKTLNASAVKNRLLVPVEAFAIHNIQKIELAQHSWVYPGTALKLRTNPAASRGEKLYTQSCLACHSLPNVSGLKPEDLRHDRLKKFSLAHKMYPAIANSLDEKASRGLIAYSEALASEKTEVKATK
jgi:hypothetical protein